MSNIFIGALIFSIWAVILFFGKTLGLSMILFVAPISYYIIYILNKNNKIQDDKAKILIIPITLLSATYFIFSNELFRVLNVYAIIVLLVLMIIQLLGDKIKINTIISKILGIIFEPLAYIQDTFKELKNNIKNKLNIKVNEENTKKKKNVLKSILIILPIVLVIILLLSSADAEFAKIFKGIFRELFTLLYKIRISGIVARVILTILLFIYFSSFFYNISFKYKMESKNTSINQTKKDNTTIAILLGVLNVIYLVFSITQIKSLFETNSMQVYSQIARKGFFQLMIVTFINIVSILIAKSKKFYEEAENKKYINIMCIVMCIFTFLILIASSVRMYFYEQAYGYTLLRILVYCIQFTEVLLLIPTILFILDKKVNLIKVYSTIIITIYICINFANLDNLIAKRNIDRYIETGKIDMIYLTNNLSLDAVNQITRLTKLDSFLYEDTEEVKMQARMYLKEVYDCNLDERKFDIREFNLSECLSKSRIKKGVI